MVVDSTASQRFPEAQTAGTPNAVKRNTNPQQPA